LLTYLPILLGIAFVILGERKLLAAIQRREGPSIVGFYGLLQSFVDGFKLILKENILPYKSNKIIFIISALLIFCSSLFTWVLIPTSIITQTTELRYTIFLMFFLSILNGYCVILSGWSSNSKYSLLGALRSTSQIISYEVYFGLLLVPVFLFSKSFSFTDIIFTQQNLWFIFLMLPVTLMFFITALAETNRTPFDLPEAEAEIVAGYNVEYAGLVFSFFFLAEYNNIFIICTNVSIFFLGGYSLWNINSEIMLFIKSIIFVILFIFLRGILPRYRYDQLMAIGWKKYLPIILGFILFYSFLFNLIINE
jgi:NADH-quinone oxidoreductase subunit H